MYFTVAAISALAAVASAVTAPSGTTPSGNPISHPTLNELIPAGQKYTITWTPTTDGPISLLLLRGPSTNVIPILTIADSVPNTGNYTWQVPIDLQPDTAFYGVELIVEGTGQFQYSPQCGVANTNAAASSSGAEGGYPVTTTVSLVPASYTPPANSSTPYSFANATGTGGFSSPVLSPTGSITKPATLSSAEVTPSATLTFAPTSVSNGPSVTSNAAVANIVGGAGWLLAGAMGVLAL